ncbi:MAG: hypothetical protein ABI414_00555 [Devosia sp.]
MEFRSMEMADGSAATRRDTIATAIAVELARQGLSGAGVDIAALTGAVEAAIAGPGAVSEGKHPDELNATNDD